MSDQKACAPFDPKLVVPFVKSVRDVMGTMAGIELEVGRPGIKADPVTSYDVSAIIQFSGDVVGTVVLSFEMDSAKRVVEAFAGMAIDPSSGDFADALGELCNMVAGAAKPGLGYEASIGLPSVIIGPHHHIARLKDVPCLVVPCTGDGIGKLAVEVSIKPAAGAVRLAA